MELIYRGVKYQKNLAQLPSCEGQIAGKYRGQTWENKYFLEWVVPQSLHSLKYRGSNYIGVFCERINRISANFTPEITY